MSDNPPAFPLNEPDRNGFKNGMTLRDWFAGQALCGLVQEQGDETIDEVAIDAYAYADAMLAERKKDQSHG